MIITKDFVFLHVPRTGGNFVRAVLLRSSQKPRVIESVEPRLQLKNKYWRRVKRMYLQIVNPLFPLEGGAFHGAYVDIPERYQHTPVVAIKRDPLAYYVSCYLFNRDKNDPSIYDWRERYRENREQGNLSIGNSPLPNFAEFLVFYNEVLPGQRFLKWSRGRHMGCRIGFMTFIYIWFFFKDPVEVLVKTDEELLEYFESQRWKQGICPVRFLRTEHLNQDLYDFLCEMGYNRENLSFVLKEKKVNASRGNVKVDYSEELVNYIKEKDRIYYRYFYASANLAKFPVEHPPPPPPPPP